MDDSDNPSALQHGRSILCRLTQNLTLGDMNWRVLPDAKSIGEMLLCIGASEYVMIASVDWNEREPGRPL